ncbi:LacI family transcriptional regulator [Salmonella enterica]|nr:LacI family transcriptional regulator [Salmonella enterica]ECP4549615.1 LacI family transcriptional regulator [Salmonella enterica]EDI7910385.1 LacI family transcriptional regulator [Salmonella enterica]EJO5101307.1 LacI family DNA-binding transcriptional regulator [Salmonella enterica]EKT4826315.1 LacI family DNA-binding transcriptional regulator [Salmonella enterica]
MHYGYYQLNTNEIKALRLDEPSVDEQQVTSKQVAREANVSQSTVSLVLSGKAEGRVSLKTRQLVEETARRMGYRPNLSARSLRTGVSMTIALAVPDVKQPFFGEVLYAAEKLAASKGYSVILVDTSSEPLWAERIVQMIESMTIAGCIVYACDRASDKVLARTGNKIIYIEAEDSDLCHIDLNASSGIEQVLQHLTSLGHTKIGYFAAQYNKSLFRYRFKAFTDRVALHNLPTDERWYVGSTFELDNSTEKAMRLIRSGVTAIFCDDDLLAGAVYRACRQAGLRIPEDMSIVGFNDIEMARMLYPELTTVAIPAAGIGTMALEMFFANVLGNTGRANPEILELELVVRDSTCSPA